MDSNMISNLINSGFNFSQQMSTGVQQTTAVSQITTASTAVVPTYVGFICAAISVLSFGSNFVPVKKHESGDGFFFQWIMCIAIWCVGLIVQVSRGSPTFYPEVMLGGALWCIGNCFVVTIISCIGLSLGLLLWGSFNLSVGWAAGRFGFFNTIARIPGNPTLDYIGVGLAFFSSFIYMNVKTMESPKDPKSYHHEQFDEDSPLVPDISTSYIPIDSKVGSESFTAHLSPKMKRIVGIVLSIISGVLYGFNFTPATYVQDNYPGASQNGLDYVFSHFCGILATSTVLFSGYAIIKRNKPFVNVSSILPSLICGALWGIAQSSWFIANKSLGMAIAFPIISTGPGIIGALWSVFLFKEIQGRRNYIILLIAFAFTISGSLLCGFSI